MGASAGGLDALSKVLPVLRRFPASILIVQHISPHSDNYLAAHFQPLAQNEVERSSREGKPSRRCGLHCAQISHCFLKKTIPFPSTDEKSTIRGPSIDVLFESAAYAKGGNIIRGVLTGANHDGSAGQS